MTDQSAPQSTATEEDDPIAVAQAFNAEVGNDDEPTHEHPKLPANAPINDDHNRQLLASTIDSAITLTCGFPEGDSANEHCVGWAFVAQIPDGENRDYVLLSNLPTPETVIKAFRHGATLMAEDIQSGDDDPTDDDDVDPLSDLAGMIRDVFGSSNVMVEDIGGGITAIVVGGTKGGSNASTEPEAGEGSSTD